MTIQEQKLTADLMAIGAATLFEAQGGVGALDESIKPILSTMKAAGPAFTVSAMPGDNLVIHHAMLKVSPGDVLVINVDGYLRASPWGDVLTEAAIQVGLAGVVVYGAVRDCAAICELGFPVFASGSSIRGTLKNQPGTLNGPVVVGDTVIYPGDFIVGDIDGVVAISRTKLESVYLAAKQRQSAEATMRARIRAGDSTVEIMNLAGSLARFGMK